MLKPAVELQSFRNVQMSIADTTRPKISILKKEHIKEVSELFTNSFCHGEPLCKHLGISHDDFKPYALEVIEKAVNGQLSVVALNQDGQVTGCVIAEDVASPIKSREYKFLRPIEQLLKTLSKPFTEKKYKKNSVAHIWITAVVDEQQGLGLSSVLNNACVALVLQQGFSYVLAEFTSTINEKFMNRFPEYLKCELKFKDFLLDGQRPFATLEGVASAYIWAAAPHVRLADIELCLVK